MTRQDYFIIEHIWIWPIFIAYISDGWQMLNQEISSQLLSVPTIVKLLLMMWRIRPFKNFFNNVLLKHQHCGLPNVLPLTEFGIMGHLPDPLGHLGLNFVLYYHPDHLLKDMSTCEWRRSDLKQNSSEPYFLSWDAHQLICYITLL